MLSIIPVKINGCIRVGGYEIMPIEQGYYVINVAEDKVIADCLEALIGAMYLDKGLNTTEKVILNLWKNHIKKSVVTQIDAKTKLQESALKNFKKLPIYKLISNSGPSHKPLFKVGVKLPNTKYFIGSGNSKKDAEQKAALECLKSVK